MLSIRKFTQEQIKEINRVNIINMIRDEKLTTKHDISKALGLSIPTVITNINALLDEGIVKEAGAAKSTGGRKPIMLEFAKNARYSFGVSITKYHVMIRLINLDNEVLFESTNEYIDITSSLKLVKEVVNKVIKQMEISRTNILGIGFALPGICDDDELILVKAPNLKIDNFSFKNFSKEINLKVWIENEANIAAFAELKVGKAKGIDNFVYVSITEGIGTGIIIKHHIYKSNQKRAGEFGHTRVTEQDIVCNCGRTGCWELVASKVALIRYYEELSGNKIVNEAEIFKLYGSGNTDAKIAVQKHIKYLLYGIENIIIGLDPDNIIIGGEFGKYSEQLNKAILDSKLTDKNPLSYQGCNIMFSALEDIGALVGAALLPLEELFNCNENVI